MTRPIYQTPTDLENEKSVIDRFSNHFNLEVEKLPDLSTFDYFTVHKDRSVFIEIKNRSCSVDYFVHYFISAKKIISAKNVSDRGMLPLLLVNWSDGIGISNLLDFCFMAKAGRSDRNDPMDIELMCYYEIKKKFKMLDI